MRHWRYSTVVAEFWLYGRKAVRGLKSLEARDFSRVRLHERYLPLIRFICLAMSERYIDHHFGEIIGFESEIESRLIDADCTKDALKADNKRMIDGFQDAGEQIVLIDSD